MALGLLVLTALALPGTTEATSFNEMKKLLAFGAQTGDFFGWSVAVSGDTAVVGAWGEEAGGSNAGAAFVYQRNAGGVDNWGEVKKLTASDAQSGDNFGVSVAISGDTVVVGAENEDAGATDAGAAYVFQRNAGGADNWGEVKKLIASDAQFLDQFGDSVAVSGDTTVVGAGNESARGSFAGAAYVFHRNQDGADNWGQVKKLTASDAQSGDFFGDSVAISGDTIVAGATSGFSNAGGAYIFQRNQGGVNNWGQVKKLAASDAEAGDHLGFGVAVDGGTAVVGAFGEDTGGTSAGAAYVFQRNKGGADNWGQAAKLTASDAAAGDQFGSEVTINGDNAVVGATSEGSGGAYAGAAYVFQRNAGGVDNWGEAKKLTASDAAAGDFFGKGVAVRGDTALVGAWRESAGGSAAGAVYVFDLLRPKPTPSFTPTATTTPTPTVPPPVGGISLDTDLKSLPLETANPGSSPWGIAVGIVAVASLFALGGAAWYAGRWRRAHGRSAA